MRPGSRQRQCMQWTWRRRHGSSTRCGSARLNRCPSPRRTAAVREHLSSTLAALLRGVTAFRHHKRLHCVSTGGGGPGRGGGAWPAGRRRRPAQQGLVESGEQRGPAMARWERGERGEEQDGAGRGWSEGRQEDAGAEEEEAGDALGLNAQELRAIWAAPSPQPAAGRPAVRHGGGGGGGGGVAPPTSTAYLHRLHPTAFFTALSLRPCRFPLLRRQVATASAGHR